MKFKWFLVLALISLSLASACSQAVPPPPVNRKTPLFENAIQARNRVDAIAAATAYLALQTGLDSQDIQFIRYEPAAWDNLCLDYPASQEICPPDNVSGYKFFFMVNNLLYEVHSDLNGTNLRLSPEIVFSNPPIESVIKVIVQPVKYSSGTGPFLKLGTGGLE